MTNLEIIKNISHQPENLKQYAATNIRWTAAQSFPYAGTYIGLKNITTHIFNRLALEWDDFKFIPEDYVVYHDKVIAYGNYSGTYKKTNKNCTARVAHLWKLKDGQIISFEQFVDSKPIIDVMLP